jgi:hypothetical protein
MSMANGNHRNPIEALHAAVKADPAKAAVLLVLVGVMVVLWVRAMGNYAPAPARASIAYQVTDADRTIAAAAAGPHATSSALAEWMRAPIGPMERNLFSVKLDYFRQDASVPRPAPRASGDEGFWDQLAKSMADQADQRKQRQILIENLQYQAAQLKMQSTLMGSQPRAMINNSLVSEGDVVAGFRVLKIEARRIIVEREGIKLEVLMK